MLKAILRPFVLAFFVVEIWVRHFGHITRLLVAVDRLGHSMSIVHPQRFEEFHETHHELCHSVLGVWLNSFSRKQRAQILADYDEYQRANG